MYIYVYVYIRIFCNIQVSHIRIFPVPQTHTAELILHICVSHVRTYSVSTYQSENVRVLQYSVTTHSRTHSAYICVPYQNIFCFHTHTHYPAHLQVSHQSNILCPHITECILHTYASHIRTCSVSIHTHIILRMSKSRIQSNILFLHTAERILHIYVSHIRTYSVSTHFIMHIYKSRALISVHTQQNSFCIRMCRISEHILFPHTHTLSCI